MTLVPRLRPPRREQLPEWFACAFAAGVALLHPLIFDDFFFNINRFKFGVFAVSAYAGLIVFLLLCAARGEALNERGALLAAARRMQPADMPEGGAARS